MKFIYDGEGDVFIIHFTPNELNIAEKYFQGEDGFDLRVYEESYADEVREARAKNDPVRMYVRAPGEVKKELINTVKDLCEMIDGDASSALQLVASLKTKKRVLH